MNLQNVLVAYVKWGEVTYLSLPRLGLLRRFGPKTGLVFKGITGVYGLVLYIQG